MKKIAARFSSKRPVAKKNEPATPADTPAAPAEKAASSAKPELGPEDGFAVRALAAPSKSADLKAVDLNRRQVGPKDVFIEIKYSGVCHSDISQVRQEWGAPFFPMVPGHEIVGIVSEVGDEVSKYEPGMRVGVGCMVDSCRSCAVCKGGDEQYCAKGCTATYNAKSMHGVENGSFMYGGYSAGIVVDEDFVVSVPETLDFAASAPLLCAGITVYSPMRKFGLNEGHRFAVAGMGGLGHMAIKFAKAFGAHVTVLSRSPSKEESALALGADDFVNTRDEAAVQKAAASFDMVLDTIGAQHDINQYLSMIKLDGTLAMVGLPPTMEISPFSVIMPRRNIMGSLFGSIKETQEMLDFCGEHDVVSDIELIPATTASLRTAFDRTMKADVKYRFVMDMSTLE